MTYNEARQYAALAIYQLTILIDELRDSDFHGYTDDEFTPKDDNTMAWHLVQEMAKDDGH